MKNFLLKFFLTILILMTGKASTLQAFNANFGYTVNCRTITLTDSSTGSNNAYIWTFGDGGSTYAHNPQYTYALNGTYNVTLEIICYDSSSGNFLKKDTMMKQITISCSTCNISANFSEMRDPLIDKKMIFTNLTGGQTTYNSVWDFGYSGNGGSTVKNPNHTFPASGYYYVKLKSNYYDAGLGRYCYDSIIKEVLVNKLRANFGYTVDSANCTTVSFYDSSAGNPTYTSWSFGDNNWSNSNNPVHTYGTSIGSQTFQVTLMIYAYDSSNSTYYGDTITKSVTIPPCNICLLNAYIYMGGDSTIPWQGNLYNYSTGTINKHHWDFGDGTTSTSNAPTHSYANPGIYTITYIAYDTTKSNCTDTMRVTFRIDSAGFLKRKAFTVTVIDKTTTGLSKVGKPEDSHLKVYPNPASSYFKIEGVKQIISIYDLKGSCLRTFPINDNEIITIPTDDWPKGLYLIVGENKERLKLMLE